LHLALKYCKTNAKLVEGTADLWKVKAIIIPIFYLASKINKFHILPYKFRCVFNCHSHTFFFQISELFWDYHELFLELIVVDRLGQMLPEIISEDSIYVEVGKPTRYLNNLRICETINP